MTFEGFLSLIHSSCFYCGKSEAGGVDRYDNDLGYDDQGNSKPCCWPCNEMKSSKHGDEFLRICGTIAKNHSAETV